MYLYTNLTFVRVCVRAEGQRKLLTQPAVVLAVALAKLYKVGYGVPSVPSGTSSELEEALCNSGGEKLDRDVSLPVAAKRR